jgi:parallel beta-helix repeat protein
MNDRRTTVRRRPRGTLLAVVALGLGLCVALPLAATASASHARTVRRAARRNLYVSPHGTPGGPCSPGRPCSTISRAVSIAKAGATINVAAGTYKESVAVRKRVKLVAQGDAVIDATGKTNGILLEGAAAAGSLVQGFTVENAKQEGILAEATSRVTIRDNDVRHNDLGMFDQQLVGECAPQGEVPGDCGEGIHLMGVTDSKVLDNVVRDNAGGILLTDEPGPTSGNLIDGNIALNNLYDCGITIAGHNPGAVTPAGRQQSVAGIFGNTISNNVSDGNGLLGEGAGILLAGAGPGTGVYQNTVTGNTAIGNNMAGIVLHNHAPGEDLNGNVITNNVLVQDNLGGDPDAGVTDTTGILLWSAVDTVTGTVVTGNTISHVSIGIFTTNVSGVSASGNTFSDVTTPLQS